MMTMTEIQMSPGEQLEFRLDPDFLIPIGAPVWKKTGDYRLPGVVTAFDGQRYMVVHPGGIRHIYSAANLELLTRENITEWKEMMVQEAENLELALWKFEQRASVSNTY